MHIRLSRDRHIAMPLVRRVYDIDLHRKEQSENQPESIVSASSDLFFL